LGKHVDKLEIANGDKAVKRVGQKLTRTKSLDVMPFRTVAFRCRVLLLRAEF
jgi:hypothetical protein